MKINRPYFLILHQPHYPENIGAPPARQEHGIHRLVVSARATATRI
jgi:hypothetical protein